MKTLSKLTRDLPQHAC